VLELRADDDGRFGRALAALDGAIEIGEQPPPAAPVVRERIGP
jgi:thymidine phosphorylase